MPTVCETSSPMSQDVMSTTATHVETTTTIISRLLCAH